MIKHLEINNLVLIENCKIAFNEGLTIISGETGAGKSAFIQALSLVLGARADSSYIRKNAEKASVEAAFIIDDLPLVHEILAEGGIEIATGDYLLIRRELTIEGRNRAFINCQMATLPLLQKVGAALIDLIGQHSHQELRSSDHHRIVLDLFGDLHGEVANFKLAWTKEKEVKQQLASLLESASKKEKELAICRGELEELLEVNPQEGEEERLFEEYKRLSHSQELTEKIDKIQQGLFEAPQAIAPQLQRFKNLCASLSQIDVALHPSLELLQSACIALEEVSPLLTSYASNLENDPARLVFLDERMKALHQLKRKYGNSFEETKKELQQRVNTLENLDLAIEEIRNLAIASEKRTADLAAALTQKRKKSAQRLEKLLTKSLQSLNMTGAELKISLTAQPRSSSGEDLITFWLHANTGEEAVSVKESSSGGELSRLMLSIKTTLAEKNNTPTIIFDEIDANVGGETAALIGQELKTLSKHRQILCITHFPQVACQADTHLRVRKEVISDRTIAQIELLSVKEKEKELLRMLGGAPIELATK